LTIVSAMSSSSTPSLDDSLRDLHEQYIDAVNRAVAEGRDDLVAALASAYTDDAMVLMSRLLPFAA
jgi:hypothetical protein